MNKTVKTMTATESRKIGATIFFRWILAVAVIFFIGATFFATVSAKDKFSPEPASVESAHKSRPQSTIAGTSVEKTPELSVEQAGGTLESSSEKETSSVLPSSVIPAPETAPWWVERHEANRVRIEMGNVDLLLIGDSIIGTLYNAGSGAFDYYYGDRNTVNMGFSGDRTQQVLWRLDHLPMEKITPKGIVLLIGANNLYDTEKDGEVAAGILACVKKLRGLFPTTPILLLDMTPERELPEDEINARMPNVTAMVHQQVADIQNVMTRNIGRLWCDEKGRSLLTMTQDHCHPNATGCHVWLADMEPILAEWLNVEPKEPMSELSSGQQ